MNWKMKGQKYFDLGSKAYKLKWSRLTKDAIREHHCASNIKTQYLPVMEFSISEFDINQHTFYCLFMAYHGV